MGVNSNRSPRQQDAAARRVGYRPTPGVNPYVDDYMLARVRQATAPAEQPVGWDSPQRQQAQSPAFGRRTAEAGQRYRAALETYNKSQRNPFATMMEANQAEQQRNDAEMTRTSRVAKLQAVNNAFAALGNTLAGIGGVRTGAVNQAPLYRNLSRMDQLRRNGQALREQYATLGGKQQQADAQGQLAMAKADLEQAQAQDRLDADIYRYQQTRADKMAKEQREEDRYQQTRQDRLQMHRDNLAATRQRNNLTVQEADRRHQQAIERENLRHQHNMEAIGKRNGSRASGDWITFDGGGDAGMSLHLNEGIKGYIDDFAAAHANDMEGNLAQAISLHYRDKDAAGEHISMPDITGYQDLLPYWFASLTPEQQEIVRIKVSQDDDESVGEATDLPTSAELDQMMGNGNWRSFAAQIGLKYKR